MYWIYTGMVDFVPKPEERQQSATGNGIEQKDMGSFFMEMGASLDEYAPLVGFLFTAILALMFVYGVVKLGYALTTKTGMQLKGSTGMLITIPIIVVSVRLFFIFSFTTKKPDVTLIVSDVIAFVQGTGFYTALGMVLIALIMRLFYKLLNHPEYGRWSKRLFQGAVLLTILSAIMPTVIQSI
ncbi:hypothetical protein [Gracilibacillus sp. YIM 98692]|uniref:hypothetical protein n=1 Tax=Gracilibacillus sp. YIM 98692 TaxID=2663532 RepID=UPI0013D504DF|nr:hypothetical protein [Gracilibacillus sp. YIM 98692]